MCLGRVWENLQDPNLKRCFGVDRKIADCGWEYLSGLETLREPREKLPRLEDLLAWLNGDARLHIWLLLDIKVRVYSSFLLLFFLFFWFRCCFRGVSVSQS